MAKNLDREPTAVQLADLLRGEILAGHLASGARLPSRHDLARYHRCSGRTLQQAIHTLTAEGFLLTAPRRATTVHPQPPHRHRILVAFPAHPEATNPRWPSFFGRLWQLAGPVGVRLDLEIRPVADVPDDPARDAGADLVSQAARRCCAGVLLTVLPRYQPRLYDALRQTGIPLAVIGYGPEAVPTVVLDEAAWWREAARAIVRHGMRRVCVVANQRRDDDAWLTVLRREIVLHDLILPDHLVHEVPIGLEREQRRLGRLLGQLPPSEAPEALLLIDDNLVEGVCQGLLASPTRPLVVAHANFPDPPPAPMSCVRFGPDVAEILAIGCGLLANRNVGSCPSLTAPIRVMES